MTTRAIVWFRRDLRLGDNPAWAAASRAADRVVGLYVLDPIPLARAGGFRRTQLLAHLHGLNERLQRQGGCLMVRTGTPAVVVPEVVTACGAATVYANADVTPYSRARDEAVARQLGEAFVLSWGNLVHPPGTVVTAKKQTPRVFTPFFTRWSQLRLPGWPEFVPVEIDANPGEGLAAVESEPFQVGGEGAALNRLRDFAHRVDDYDDTRDIPSLVGTSILSADLRFGTLAPRTAATIIGTSTNGRASFIRQLAWRDWYAHLLWEIPSLVDTALRPELDNIVWENDHGDIAAWQSGQTGYPFVDAGMRQLASTGWMHNRARMVAASFLVKDLLVDWRIGERWFRRLLVDADIAQNAGNWQWVAGTGPDAAPYFRVFNPVRQSKKFDPDGEYIRAFVPELAGVSTRWIHSPWTAPSLELAASRVTLGATYPHRIIEHDFARGRALSAYAAGTEAIKSCAVSDAVALVRRNRDVHHRLRRSSS